MDIVYDFKITKDQIRDKATTRKKIKKIKKFAIKTDFDVRTKKV